MASNTQYTPPVVRHVNYTNEPKSIIGCNVTVEAGHLERSRKTDNFEKSEDHQMALLMRWK